MCQKLEFQNFGKNKILKNTAYGISQFILLEYREIAERGGESLNSRKIENIAELS